MTWFSFTSTWAAHGWKVGEEGEEGWARGWLEGKENGPLPALMTFCRLLLRFSSPPPPPGRLASSLLPALGVSRDPASAGEGNKTSKNKSRFGGASSTLKWAGGPYEVTVLFPLVSEDPLVEQRQLCSLGEVRLVLCCLGGGSGHGTKP